MHYVIILHTKKKPQYVQYIYIYIYTQYIHTLSLSLSLHFTHTIRSYARIPIIIVIQSLYYYNHCYFFTFNSAAKCMIIYFKYILNYGVYTSVHMHMIHIVTLLICTFILPHCCNSCVWNTILLLS